MRTTMSCPPTRWRTRLENLDGTVSLVSGFVSKGRSSTTNDSSVGWSIVRTHQSVGMPSPSGVFCFSFDLEGVEVIVGS